jgi:hypothetical protein
LDAAAADRKGMSPAQQIQGAIDLINGITTGVASGDLTHLFHENVAFQAPGSLHITEGPVACLNTYLDFRNEARIHSFEADPAAIRSFGCTAVATYSFRIHYTIENVTTRAKGEDVLVFTNQDGRWLVVWRTLVNLSMSG